MTIWQAALLGFIQGMTEFLPVSSSGHLTLAQEWLGFAQPGVFFDVYVHFITLLVVVAYFFKRLLKLGLQGWFKIGLTAGPLLETGAVVTLWLGDVFESLWLVSGLLLVTGFINLQTDRLLEKKDQAESDEVSLKALVVMSLMQAIAVLPGISRSGSTLFGGISQGASRQKVFETSFMMSIPVIFAAMVVQWWQADWVLPETIGTAQLIAGGVTAAGAGLASLTVLEKIWQKATYQWFGYYCIGLGGLSLVARLFLF